MTNLKTILKKQTAFIPYVVADDPNFDTTVQSILTLANNGADLIEIGIPFSDPVADGPAVQAADLRAFQAGVNTEVVFDIVAKVREQSDIPVILATYLNIAFKYGYDKFCQRCQSLNIIGLNILDAPVEEYREIEPAAQKYEVALMPTIAPASEQRIPTIVGHADGAVNLVVAPGTTDLTETLLAQIKHFTQKVQQISDVAVVISFDANTKQAEQLSEVIDGIIIGNPVTELVAENRENLQQQLADLASGIKDALQIKA